MPIQTRLAIQSLPLLELSTVYIDLQVPCMVLRLETITLTPSPVTVCQMIYILVPQYSKNIIVMFI
jgi:hypothetical protein